jgi:hypothetical protein
VAVIKAELSNGALLLGLSAMNIAKLKEGLPIVFDGRPFGLASDVIIMYGETEEAIASEIMTHTGVGGSG